MLEVSNLVVRYDELVAVKGISFEVREGEIFGLLGPNGAGKSSILKAIIGLVDFEGEVKLFGRKITPEMKNDIGYVPEEPILIETLTPAEFFEFLASVRGKGAERAKALVRAFEFESYMNRPIATLSMGNRRKVSIISALMHEPMFLIMDEPLNGLDAKSSRILKEIMRRHVEKGGAILFSTHIMEIAEKLCDRIAVLSEGRIIAMGTFEELKSFAKVEGTLEDVFLTLTGGEDVREIVDAIS